MSEIVDQQLHGYRGGHQLLSSSVKLSREDQDAIDRLSDMAGLLRPGEKFEPYLSTYPLPSAKYYVVARTWQDLAAPRAGCVLTRSLLVPMRVWEQAEDLGEFLAFLTPVDRNERVHAVEAMPSHSVLPPVHDPRVVELVEALFLESRQPVVFFDTQEGETIAVRLLSALWPGLRRNFATCTFALAPRRIGDREFDLVFAPKSARSRFSDWQGRRIDAKDARAPRHRWSSMTVDHIFQSPHPSLASNDTLGFLKNDLRGDESALRLTLLWNELTEKADSTPSAVLGLLDILNSQRTNTAGNLDKLLPVLQRAITVAGVEFAEQDAWRFVSTLAGKFGDDDVPQSLLSAIREAAEKLSRRDPRGAFQFIEEEFSAARRLAPVVIEGAADGLSSELSNMSSDFFQLPATQSLRLIAGSHRFARSLVEATKNSPNPWAVAIRVALQAGAREETRAVRLAVAVNLDDDGRLAPLLEAMLYDAGASELCEIVIVVGQTTAFRNETFDEKFIDAARRRDCISELRTEVASQFADSNADRFILRTLRLIASDIEWLSKSVEPGRAFTLLVDLIHVASGRDLREAMILPPIRQEVLQILSVDLRKGARSIALVIQSADMQIGDALDLAERVLPLLVPEDAVPLANYLFMRALSEANPADARVAMLFTLVAAKFEPRRLLELATSGRASGARVGSNVVLLDQGEPSIREWLLNHVDELSARLINLQKGDLGADCYIAWASLIGSCRNQEAALRAASASLAYALNLPRYPVSPLITASFPVVYRRLLKSREGDERNIPAFLALPLSFFMDWDRAGSARRELVDSFVRSDWPPADLMVVTMEAGIERFMFEYLSRTNSGRTYLERLAVDLRRLDPAVQRFARRRLDEISDVR